MTVLSECVGRLPVERSAAQSRVRLATAVLAVLLLVVLIYSFSRCLFYPLGQDQAFYQYVTKMTMDGYRESVAREVKYYAAFVVMQWVAIKLFGYTEMGFHAFDACWQVLTIVALIMLAGRTRRWSVGLLAGTLYALVYYGLNYQVINGRDACTGLPLLLMVHLLIPARQRDGSERRSFWRVLLAGGMGFVAYLLKLTMGMGFGLAWLYLLAQAWTHRREGRRGWIDLGAFSTGFLATATLASIAFMSLGWWDDLAALYSAFPPKGYNSGHWMMLNLAPCVLVGALLIAAAFAGTIWPVMRKQQTRAARTALLAEFGWYAICGAVVFGLAATANAWTEWWKMLPWIGGILVPAVGGMLAMPWRERPFVWRMCLLMAGASIFSLFLQGNFWVYHFIPLVLFAAYLSADELVRVCEQVARGQINARGWAVACTVSVVSLAVLTWWPRMTTTVGTRGFNVLAGTTLDAYHARVASHINHVPEYPTAVKVAARARDLTAPGEPMACLLLDTRIYYFAQRPMAHGLAFIFCRGWEQWYPAFMQSIRDKRPEVVVARVPLDYVGPRDAGSLQHVVFDDLSAKFGPSAAAIRECYRIGEIIDDVAILRPLPH